jgi:hypothetical protein
LPNPLPERDIFTHPRPYSLIWNPRYKKTLGRGRGAIPLTPDESKELIDLLWKVNDAPKDLTFQKYPGNNSQPITINLSQQIGRPDIIDPSAKINNISDITPNQIPFVTPDGTVTVEKVLEAWLMENLCQALPCLQEIVGPPELISWYGNYLPYSIGGGNIDVMIFHEYPAGSKHLFKITVIELKRDTANEGSVSEVVNYAKWVAKFLCQGEEAMVQPALIAHRIDNPALLLAEQVALPRKPILAEYQVQQDQMHFDIKFKKTPSGLY